MHYERTQFGPWQWVLLVLTGMMLLGVWLARRELAAVVLLTFLAAIFGLFSLTFATLTIRDEGEWLAVRYGPLSVFRKRIRYSDITAVEPARTTIIDGWGIQWMPGRGWTYNLWGFGCVKLTLGRKVIRVGSDDVDNLVAFLRAKVGFDVPR